MENASYRFDLPLFLIDEKSKEVIIKNPKQFYLAWIF